MARFESREEVAHKIIHEGGPEDAVEFGIKAEDMPDQEMRDAWRDLELAWHTFSQAADRIRDLIPDAEI